jgi:hypothetical protein
MQLQGQFQYNPPLITPEEWVRFQDFDMKEDILKRMEEDRAKMEQQKTQDIVGVATQLAMSIAELQMQGVSPQELQQIAYTQAQQLLGQGEEGGQMPTAPAETQAPEGVTGQMAMMNMARGM